jgi:hypothetical protein
MTNHFQVVLFLLWKWIIIIGCIHGLDFVVGTQASSVQTVDMYVNLCLINAKLQITYSHACANVDIDNGAMVFLL